MYHRVDHIFFDNLDWFHDFFLFLQASLPAAKFLDTERKLAASEEELRTLKVSDLLKYWFSCGHGHCLQCCAAVVCAAGEIPSHGL